MDNIREKDVPIKDVLVGTETIRMVESVGGISTFSNYVQKAGVKSWKIPLGTKLPESIRVVKDSYNREMRGFHYSLRPARMMTLAQYAEGLRELALSAIPMFTLPSADVSSQKKANQK
jgi:hypothetical protein